VHQFKIDGPALECGTPIHIAVTALDNFQSVLDKSYLVLSGGKRMAAKDRQIFQLRAQNFRQGSFLTEFEIALSGIQLALPFISSFGPQNLWDYTKDSFQLLKTVIGAVQRGEAPHYEFKNDGNASVHVGNETHNYYGPVIQIAELSLPHYQNLAHLIDVQRLNEVSAGIIGQKADIFIGENDRDAFDIPTRIEKETIAIQCEVFDFNKFKNTGKLSIFDETQDVPSGEYNFEIFGPQDNVEYIYSMLKPSVELFCLVEVAANPFGEEKVHKLHVTGVGS